MREAIGWASSVILVLILSKQVYRQYGSGTSEGVSGSTRPRDARLGGGGGGGGGTRRHRASLAPPVARVALTASDGQDVRDSLVLLALLLEQETELEPMEFMTDTAAYSDAVFGLFWLLGYQFSPPAG